MSHTIDERFKKLEYEYRILSENALECIWVFDIATEKFTYMSPNVLLLRGITAEEAMQESLADAVPPETYQAAMENTELMVSRYHNGERSKESLTCVRDMQVYAGENEVKQIEVTVKLLENPETGALEVLGISRDITERKTLEKQLNKALESKNEIIDRLKTSERSLKLLTEELDRKNKALSEIATKDALTGIFNRYYFDRKVIEESESCQRYSYPLSIILFDIDNFKKINDTWGHGVGDHILARIADTANRSMRSQDVLARWGGEEFVLLMPHTDLQAGIKVAEKLREKLETLQHPEIDISVTASFGVTEYIPGETKDSWFRRVDYAMFRSKNEGRNHITGASCSDTMSFAKEAAPWESKLKSREPTKDKDS